MRLRKDPARNVALALAGLFEELFEDLDDKADAVLGGGGKADGGKGGAAARADAVEEKAAAAALP